MNEKLCIASSDGHVGAPTALYRDYLEKWLHPAFDEFYARHVSRYSPASTGSFFPRSLNSKFWDTEGYVADRGTAVTWDPHLRLKAMDQSMIACEVLIPDDTNSNDPPWGSGLATAMEDGVAGSAENPPELVRAGARSYNRWLADFSSVDRDRLKGLIALGTVDDVVWCVDEIRRAFASGLTAGVLLPSDYTAPLYHHPRYDILWETCTELDLPVISHIGRGHPSYVGEDPWVQRFMFCQELHWYTQRPIWCLIMGGVLERYPDLKLIVTEAGVGWVAPLLRSLDAQFAQWPVLQASRDVPRRVDFSMKPSEYWRRQCYVAHSTCQRREEFEGEAFDAVPNMIFGADLGHHEGWWPKFGFPEPYPEHQPDVFSVMPVVPVEDAYKTLWHDLPAEKIVPYLQDDFFHAYPNFDRAALDGVVERIGPTADQLGLV